MAYIDKINKNNTDYDLQDSKAARSVNGTTDSHVELTNEIFTTSTQSSVATFAYRTTAGDISINTGPATIAYINGNTVQTGHTDEVLNAAGAFADSGTTVTLTKATWRSYVQNNGTYTFTYDGTNWKLSDATVTLADYGLVVTGTVMEGDSIVVEYTALVIGTLATATPTSFVATGFNQYDATAGYSHVVGDNQYRIAGTYTSLGFTATVGGTTTPVTVTDNKFTPIEDGYIYVNGASGDILIALVWSGTMDSEPYSAYSTTTVTIPTADSSSTALPTASYGMPSVGSVRDTLSFTDKTYVQRIGHYTYSAANLATVEALGVPYVYDLSHIFYVLPEPVTYTLASNVSGEYTANDYGTEEFIGTSTPVVANIVYGNSLVDKLRNMLPIQSVGTGLTLTGTELSASGGGQSTLYDTTGTNTDGAMTQKAATSMVFADPATRYKIKIGYGTSSNIGNNSVEIGYNAGAIGPNSVACGYNAMASASNGTAVGTSALANSSNGATAIGANASVNDAAVGGIAISGGWQPAYANGVCSIRIGGGSNAVSGQGAISLGFFTPLNSDAGKIEVGSTNTSYGYNSSNYRLLSGLYDPQSAHDAATKGYVDPTTDSSAPTTATVGRLGQIFIDTTNADAYMCVAVDTVTPSYTWKKISV